MKVINRSFIIFFSLIIIAAGAAYLFLFFYKAKTIDVLSASHPNFIIHAELAKTPAQWSRGLMYRPSLPADSGMLFIFPQESIQSFWMKNTLIPLDMIFISADQKIVDLKNNFLPCTADPCPTYQSAAPAKYVLEVNGGLVKKMGISLGENIILKK